MGVGFLKVDKLGVKYPACESIISKCLIRIKQPHGSFNYTLLKPISQFIEH